MKASTAACLASLGTAACPRALAGDDDDAALISGPSRRHLIADLVVEVLRRVLALDVKRHHPRPVRNHRRLAVKESGSCGLILVGERILIDVPSGVPALEHLRGLHDRSVAFVTLLLQAGPEKLGAFRLRANQIGPHEQRGPVTIHRDTGLAGRLDLLTRRREVVPRLRELRDASSFEQRLVVIDANGVASLRDTPHFAVLTLERVERILEEAVLPTSVSLECGSEIAKLAGPLELRDLGRVDREEVREVIGEREALVVLRPLVAGGGRKLVLDDLDAIAARVFLVEGLRLAIPVLQERLIRQKDAARASDDNFFTGLARGIGTIVTTATSGDGYAGSCKREANEDDKPPRSRAKHCTCSPHLSPFRSV